MAAGTVVAAVAVTRWLAPRPRPSAPAARFDIDLPAGWQLDGQSRAIDVSPDGRRVVFAAFRWKTPYATFGEEKLFSRPLDSWEATPLKGTEGASDPAFSPDGRWIAFVVNTGARDAEKKILRVPADGGIPETLSDRGANGLAWLGDGSLLAGGGTIVRIPAKGGKPEPVTKLDEAEGEVRHILPHVLPDGRTFLYTAVRHGFEGMTWNRSRIFAQRIGSTERSLLVEGGSDGRWAPPGILLFGRNGTLMGARLADSGLALTSRPVPIVAGVSHAILLNHYSDVQGAVKASVSRDGTLVYAPGSAFREEESTLVWVDGKGNETPIPDGKRSYRSIALSKDGTQVLFVRKHPGTQAEVLDLSRGTTRQVTFDGSHNFAVWGPDPGGITFTSDHEGPWGLYTRKLDDPPERMEPLWRAKGLARLVLTSWSPDGRTLAFSSIGDSTRMDIWTLSRDGSVKPFLATRFFEGFPQTSPDGKWIAYLSNEAGAFQVFVRPLDGSAPPRQISTSGGEGPIWARDGSAVFFLKVTCGDTCLNAVHRVRVIRAASGLDFEAPEKLFEGQYRSPAPGRAWDVAPDGRFLLTKRHPESDQKAHAEASMPTRILVDTGGVERLLTEVERKP